MTSATASTDTKFHALLQDQIRHELTAEHQYIAIAVWFDNADLPQLANRFYNQAVEEHNHAMMQVRYLIDRGISVEFTGIDRAQSDFADSREPLALALRQEREVTEQIVHLARTARDEGDYMGEQFMQWFLKEQVEEVASISTLLTVAERAQSNLFDLENFIAREMSAPADSVGAPPVAGPAR
ncbi:ferritin [Aldersonia kunmingensis]|uniref:ferritin n=1 Tax=Aldersonia kunmingensis TaxID=408066 RepID=UPI0008309FBB|nr:ferritin [Aldersonia kunmingensis]